MSIKNHCLVVILIWLLFPFSTYAEVCDVDADGDIDRNDINLILAARGSSVSGPDDPRDITGDGIISVHDVRGCSLQCSLARCEIITPPIDVPSINISPDILDFGEVFVGSSVTQSLLVNNSGTATLSVGNIESSGAPFNVFPPLSFDIVENGTLRNIEIGFSPTVAGDFTGTITFHSNAENEDPVLIEVAGRGVEPSPVLVPDIDVRDSVDFGALAEGANAEQMLTIRNFGDAPLNVSDISSDEAAFSVSALAGESIPFTLDPGASKNISVVFAAPAGSAGTSVSGKLSINSNDPDESLREVFLAGDVLPAFAPLVNNPILDTTVDEVIMADNCSNITGTVQFGAGSDGVETFNVTLTDQGGNSVNSGFFTSSSGAGVVAFSGINACGLDDGIFELTVNLETLDPYIGTPVIKHTSTFPAPILEPVEPVSVLSTIEVCGTSRENTTVKIEGGASIVSVALDASTTDFCLTVPLRSNSENTLIATAIDELAAAPRPSASANPVQVVHVDPSSIIIAEASSRPLTVEETELLVQNGVINLDDPSNFNVSMFTIVLTIGAFPVTISQPVAVPTTPGVSLGGGGGGGSGWGGSGGGGSVSACVTACSSVIVIKTPTGQTIPGVIIIDGRIKTLKEFFQVTIAIQNTSAGFTLADMQANIALPAGLSPVRAGPGTNVADVNNSGEVDNVVIGDIGPMETGTGQFIIRGDGIGTHNVDVDFNGFLTGGGLPDPFPVSGSAGTSVQVYGPPTLDVVVRHPSDPGGHDVVAGQIYELIVEITNTSPRPALYTSLELFVGGDAELVDEYGDAIPESNEIRSFGHIPSGRTVAAAFRVNPLVQGEIIACQAIASENISLTVDTGPDGSACNIANTYPANFEPLPADMPPTVLGINPLNGQPNISVTTSVFATLTPESDCIVGDTFTNVDYALIDPSDPSKGWQVISYDLVQAGTFYLQELDAFGTPVKHIPTDLTVETPPAGGATIAVLRLGLDDPHTNSQYFLQPNTSYRATLVGGIGGVCSASSAAEMTENFTWTFSTEQTCGAISAPIGLMGSPPDGSIDRPLNQAIVLNFSNRMNPASFAFAPSDLANSTFSVYANAMESGGEISGGTPIAGRGVFSNLDRTLTYTPQSNFAEDVPVYIRLTDGLRDVCGNPLQTPPSGVQLMNFQTIPPDTTAPDTPVINPIPAIINLSSIQVTGQAEAGSTITVSGGSSEKSTSVSAAGLFSVAVPLNINATNDLSVQASDASGNTSAAANTDNLGTPLVITQDNVRPVVTAVLPVNGASGIARDVIIQVNFNEQIKPETVNDLNFTLEGSVIPGTFAMVGDMAFSFTPDNLLDYNKTYTMRIRANGVRDLAGNGLASDLFASFTTTDFPLPLISSVVPDAGVQGASFSVIFSGNNLATASAVISDNPGVNGTIVNATDTSVTADINVDALAATGLTTLGLTTLGGSVSVPFTVLHKVPVINSIAPSSGEQGTTVNAQINGSGLTDISSITIDGTGVVVNDLGTGNDGVRDVQFVIDASAEATVRSVTVTTPGGSADALFTVVEFVTAPSLVTVTPNEGVQGTSLQVTFTGSNLSGASAAISSNPGITGNIVNVTDTTVIADILIAASATLGTSQLGISTPGGSDTVAFTVNAPVVPPIVTSIVPASGVQGTTVAAAINGSNLSFVTDLATDCQDVSVTDLGTGNASRLDVEFVIGVSATAGDCLATVTTMGGSATGVFSVTEAPDTITLTPATGQLLTRGNLNMTVTLNAAAPAGGQLIDLNASNALVSLPASVTVPEGALNAEFAIRSGNDNGSVEITASATGFFSDSSAVDVMVRDFSLSSPLVGIDRTVTATLNLPHPAPTGGASFNLSVSDQSIVAVSPAAITIPQGQSSATFELTGQLIIGTAIVTADGTSNGYTSQDLLISVTDRLLDLPSAQDLYLGEMVTLPLLIAPDAAGAGGVTINVESSDPAIVEVLTPVVIVPEGSFQTSAQIRAASTATGMVTITASNPGFAPDTSTVSVTTGLNIVRTTSQFDDTETDEIYFHAISGGNSFPAPVGGIEVSLASDDPSCVVVSSPVIITEGNLYGSATLSYAGTAAIPCSATVTASSSLFGSDTVAVTVASVPNIGALSLTDTLYGDQRVGSDLQIPYRLTLSESNHGGVTVYIKSSDPTLALVSPGETTVGTPVAEVFIPDGQLTYNFYVHGVSGASGGVTITASQASFSSGSTSVEVVPGVFQIIGLNANTTTLSANDPFYVQAGYVHVNGSTFRRARVSATGGPLTVSLSSSDVGVGQLATATISGSPLTVEISVNGFNSPMTVAAGGIAFDPLAGGTTTIAATAAGFDSAWVQSSQVVNVSQPGITVTDWYWGEYRVGSGQQFPYQITLGGSDHGGVTVQLESSDPAVALVAPDANTAGSATIDVAIPDGQSTYQFFVQGVSEATGSVTITASQALFSSGSTSVEVVPGVFQIIGLNANTTTLSANDPFYVQAGYVNANGTSFRYGFASATGGPLTVSLSSSDSGVGQLATATSSGSPLTVEIPVNGINSPTTVAAGGIAFDPIAGGSTTIAATALGFDSAWAQSSQVVSVSQPEISLSDRLHGDARIGGGLQAPYQITLGGSEHGGVNVRIASGDTIRLLVSQDATTAGTSFIDLFIPNGQTTANFYIQGITGVIGQVTLTASNPQFTDGLLNVNVVQGVVDIRNLATSITTGAADDPFRVGTGYVHSNGTSFRYAPVSASAAPLQVLVNSTNVEVGEVKTLVESGASVTIEIDANQFDSAATVATGGVAFDPVSAGTTNISTSVIGFNNSWAQSIETVTVTP